jgi:Zn-dependent protease with chaperone function
MKFKASSKERFYFGIMVAISCLAYFYLFAVIRWANRFSAQASSNHIFNIFCFYFILFLVIRLIASTFFIGHIKGNAIKISKKQFPDVFDIVQNYSLALNLKKVPEMYVLQGNGILNAFAIKVARKNFIILYSDIFEMAYEEGKDAVSFIIGHELGHIKRNHVGFLKSVLIFPAKFIPLLNLAYSRACEYTCDNFGYNLSPKGASKGLLLLAAGKKLYKKINLEELVNNAQNRPGFAFWLTERLSTHPHLVKRLAVLNKLNPNNVELENSNFFMPKYNSKNTEARQ